MSRLVVFALVVILVVMALGQGNGCTTSADYPRCVIACQAGTAPGTAR